MKIISTLLFTIFLLVACGQKVPESANEFVPPSGKEMSNNEKKYHYLKVICSQIPFEYSYYHTRKHDVCYAVKENSGLDRQHCYAQRITSLKREINQAFSHGDVVTGSTQIYYNPLCMSVIYDLQFPPQNVEEEQIYITNTLIQAYRQMLEQNLVIAEIPLPSICESALRIYLAESLNTLIGKETSQKRKNIAKSNYYNCLERATVNSGKSDIIREIKSQPGKLNAEVEHLSLPTDIPVTTDSDPTDNQIILRLIK